MGVEDRKILEGTGYKDLGEHLSSLTNNQRQKFIGDLIAEIAGGFTCTLNEIKGCGTDFESAKASALVLVDFVYIFIGRGDMLQAVNYSRRAMMLITDLVDLIPAEDYIKVCHYQNIAVELARFVDKV